MQALPDLVADWHGLTEIAPYSRIALAIQEKVYPFILSNTTPGSPGISQSSMP